MFWPSEKFLVKLDFLRCLEEKRESATHCLISPGWLFPFTICPHPVCTTGISSPHLPFSAWGAPWSLRLIRSSSSSHHKNWTQTILSQTVFQPRQPQLCLFPHSNIATYWLKLLLVVAVGTLWNSVRSQVQAAPMKIFLSSGGICHYFIYFRSWNDKFRGTNPLPTAVRFTCLTLQDTVFSSYL